MSRRVFLKQSAMTISVTTRIEEVYSGLLKHITGRESSKRVFEK
jgi:hypothetical protein